MRTELLTKDEHRAPKTLPASAVSAERDGHVQAAITVSGLVKTFGSTRALDGLDLEVHPGEVHGFLGPNGSGKTVTIRILLGLLRADGGTVSLLGGDPWRDAVELHRRIAYVPGEVNLWPNLSGGETIDLLARLRGGGGRTGRQNIDVAKRDQLIERLALDPTKKSRTYSKGNRQKVALIAALSSDAELMLLDEPTSGLDPLMEIGVPGVRAGGHAARAAPCCCRATSSQRSRSCAIASRSSVAAERCRPERSTRCVT